MNVGPFVPAIPQMSRSGRPPGAPREPDFYEILNPLNKRLTKLYVSAGVLSAAGVGAISYSWVLIRWEKLFSDAAKGVLLANYEARGLGGVVCLVSKTTFSRAKSCKHLDALKRRTVFKDFKLTQF